MNIKFDIFEALPGSEDMVMAEEKILFDTIKGFFIQRLKPLEGKINDEEIKNDKANVMVHLINPNPKEKVSVNGYTDELTKKIENSFTNEDMEYLNKLLIEKLGGTLN